MLQVPQLGFVERGFAPRARQVGRKQVAVALLRQVKQRFVVPQGIVGVERDQVEHAPSVAIAPNRRAIIPRAALPFTW
jgi:hypothetical protein